MKKNTANDDGSILAMFLLTFANIGAQASDCPLGFKVHSDNGICKDANGVTGAPEPIARTQKDTAQECHDFCAIHDCAYFSWKDASPADGNGCLVFAKDKCGAMVSTSQYTTYSSCPPDPPPATTTNQTNTTITVTTPPSTTTAGATAGEKGNITGGSSVANAAKFVGTIGLQAAWKEDPKGELMTAAVGRALATQLGVDPTSVTVVGAVEGAGIVVNFTVAVPEQSAAYIQAKINRMKRNSLDLITEIKKQLLEIGFPEADLGAVQISTFTAKKDCGSDTSKSCNEPDSAMVSDGPMSTSPIGLVMIAALAVIP